VNPTPLPPDDSLLELFCAEVNRHAATLADLLTHADFSSESLELMQRSAHEIWGGARLVALEPVALLAKAIKERLSTEIDEGQRLGLVLAADWLLTLSEQAPHSLRQHLNADKARWMSLYQTVSGKDFNEHELSQPTEKTGMITAPPPVTTPPPAPPVVTAASAPPVAPASPIAPLKVDPALLELFVSEVQTHTDVLNEGLLILESKPQAREPLEALMRSAHSIKGGARVVGLDIAVKLAHVMEDCFVAAQRNQLQLASMQVDALLHAVDTLSHLAQAAVTGDHAQLTHAYERALALIQTLNALYHGEAPPLTPPPSTSTSTSTSPSPVPVPEMNVVPEQGEDSVTDSLPVTVNMQRQPQAQPTVISTSENTSPPAAVHDSDRTVRVTAHKIERLMGLAGEVTVSARWLPPFSDSLLTLKRAQMELTTILEKLQDHLNQNDADVNSFKELQKARDKNKECTAYLADRLNQLDVFTSTFATHADRLYREVIGVRMRPFADGAKGFPRMMRDLARQLGKKVQFEIIGKSTEVDQDIQEKLDAPLTHLLRNAMDHGLESPRERRAAGKPETGTIRMEVSHRSGMLMITVSDDGRGVDPVKLRAKILRKGLAGPDIVAQLSDNELMDFLFLPGFSTAAQITEISGRGVGLDVVHSMVHEVGGLVRAESKPGQGMRFHLELPLTLSVIRTFLVEIAGEPYAFPLTRIDRCLRLNPTEIEVVEDRQYFRFSNNNIALVNIHDVLELNSSPPQVEEVSVVVVSDRFNIYGLVVDRFIGEYDLVVRPLDPRLGKVPDISAVAVMLDGSPVLIFDIEDLVHSIDKRMGARRLRKISENEPNHEQRRRLRILVVDDSITVREMERKLLEHRGYHVEVAVDGMDGWNAVRSEHFDLVVSDIDMPRMNGIELVKRIKQTDHLHHLPVVIVSYKDTEEHRLQGLEAGANYYLTKSSFEDESFINAVTDLIGET
jgi:two-component system, chemotaxis family, sensor histidine kinase and response regulator WspE